MLVLLLSETSSHGTHCLLCDWGVTPISEKMEKRLEPKPSYNALQPKVLDARTQDRNAHSQRLSKHRLLIVLNIGMHSDKSHDL